MSDGAHDPWTRWFAGIAAALLAILAVLVVVASIRGPTVNERLQRVEAQLSFISCVILLPADERTVVDVANCHIPEERETP